MNAARSMTLVEPGERGRVPSSGIQRLELGDEPQVFALFDEVFGEGSGEAHRRRFQWQYREGGLGEGATMWLFWHHGRLVGSLGILPATLYLEGTPYPVKFTADLASAPAWRNRGIGARLMQAFVKAPGIPLAFGVSDDARNLLVRMGFEEVAGLTPFFRVLSYAGLALRRYRVPMTASWTGPKLETLLRGMDRVRPVWEPTAARIRALRESPWPQPRGEAVRITWPRRFPMEIDALSGQLARAWTVIHSPDSAELNRRYVEHPHHDYHLEVAWRGKQPVGYAAWRLFTEPDGLKMATLSTWQVLPGDETTLDVLIDAGSARMAHLGAFAIKGLAPTPFHQAGLRRHLFFPHGDSPGLFFHTDDEALRALLRRPWVIGLGTADVDVS